MCNLYSITTNQAAIIALFRVMNRYVGNLASMPGVFPDYPAPVVRNAGAEREMVMMRWGMPPPPRAGGFPVTNIRNTTSPHCRGWLKRWSRCSVPPTLLPEMHRRPIPRQARRMSWGSHWMTTATPCRVDVFMVLTGIGFLTGAMSSVSIWLLDSFPSLANFG